MCPVVYKNQTHLVLKEITSDCGLSSPLMKCRQLSRSNRITTKDLCNFRGCALVECLSSGLEFLQDLKVCMFVFVFSGVFKLGHQSVLFVFFLFGALFVNRSAQKLKHMHVLSCSSFSVLLCGTVLHLKVEQVRIFFLLCSLFSGMQ
jgi:hypothetical protein